jgi:hypothetical protein
VPLDDDHINLEDFAAEVEGLVAEHDLPALKASRMLIRIARKLGRNADTKREREAIRREIEGAYDA